MADAFSRALAFTLTFEGGLADDPEDRGGRTMKGVRQDVYDAYRAARLLTVQDVALITDDDLRNIYRDDYWRKAHCDEWPAPVDLVVFDAAVNSGSERAVRWLQRAVGATEDGRVGPATRKAVEAASPLHVVARVCNAREAFLRRLAAKPGQAKFLRGWLRRVAALRAEAGLPPVEVS